MILLYTGTPGSGKSLHLAHDIYAYLNRRKERLVICNFDIDLDRVKHPERFIMRDNDDLSPEYVISECLDYWSSGDGCIRENEIVLIIDECQLIFNSRSWNEKGRKEWLSFFSQHRKYGVLCILVCQFDMMIDKQIRALVEYEVVHRKLTNFGTLGNIIKVITFGDVFIAVEKWYALGKKTGSYLFKARKKYYSLYNTFNTFGESADKKFNNENNSVAELMDMYKAKSGDSLHDDYYDLDYR